MRRLVSLSFSASALLLAAPALADHPIAGGAISQSGPILTLSADALPAGTVAGGIELQATFPDSYTDAELIAFAGAHVHAHTTDRNLSATASLAYGVTGHFTLMASLPFVHRKDLRTGHHSHAGGAVSNTVDRLGSVSGVGDLSLLGQYVFAHDHAAGWFASALGGVKAPTGSTGMTDPLGARLETEHQPGSGSWDPLFGLAASKAWGATSLHGSAFYQLSTEGAQATRLGDRLQLGTALVHNLRRSASHAHAPGAAHHDHAPPSSWAVMLEATYEHESRTRIAGVVEPDSGSEVLWLSPGMRYTAPAGWSAGLSAGVPLWQDVGISHPANDFRLVAQVGASF